MSIYSALTVGISGILGQSDAINTISGNIANADTIGYKEGMTSFADLVSDNSANNYSVNGNGAPDVYLSYSGATSTDISLNDVQGVINGSNSETDLAISGEGFFAVSPTATDSTSNLEYTRAGSFTPDANGNYANAAGEFLLGWALNPDGTLPAALSGSEVSSGVATAALVPVNIQKIIPIPVPTTTVSVAANLNSSQATYTGSPPYDPTNPANNMASGAVAPDFTIPITVIDSTGASHTLDASFLQGPTVLSDAGPGPFAVTSGSTSVTVTGTPPTGLANGDNVTFNGSGAILDSNGNTMLTAAQMNSTFAVSNVTAGGYTITLNQPAGGGVAATGDIDFSTSGMPNPGDTITLNGVQWQFVNNGATGNEINIGANLSDTVANMASALNASTNPAITVATYGVSPAGPASTELTITDNTQGTVGNNYTLAASAATPSSATLTGGATTTNTGALSTAGGAGIIDQDTNNTWAVEVYAQSASDVTAANGQVAYGTATFNGDGTLATISPALTNPVPITWTDAGAAASDITFNWGTAGPLGTGEANGLSQDDNSYNINNIQQNGLAANTSTTVAVSSSGIVSVTYSGGGTRDLYQIPLAQFANPNQLQTLNANTYAPTADSGKLTFFSPGQNTQATLVPDALEDSNVDLSTQLSNLIVAQNAYQSNSELVSTSDQMLQTLTQMDQPITV